MVLDRKALESMRRSELQKLCKDYGVKANLKSDALIDLLIETSKPNTSPRTRAVSRRSTRNSSTRISSAIVHDVEEEEGDEENQDAEEAHRPEPEPTSQRTRKAKETQKKLGVGRPVAAGGTGARAVTRSASYSKAKKSRTSKSIKPIEETIIEEAETENNPPDSSHGLSASLPPSPKDQIGQTPALQEQARDDITQIDQRIADALQPLLEQVHSLKAELEKMQSLKTELASVKSQVADVGTLQQKVNALTTEVDDLKAVVGSSTTKENEIHHLKEQVSTLTDHRLALGSPIPSSSTERPLTPPHPGFAPSMLGKRQRDSTASNITGLVEEDQDDLSESELAKRIIRPSKKRLRIDQEHAPSSNQVDDGVRTPPRVYNFSLDTIVDQPPPTTPLPDFYRAAASPTRQVANNQNANATDNRPYLVVPPTPGPGMFAAANFSYPEPPPSPTPAATTRYGYIDNPNRTDIFKTFAMPPPTRVSPPPVSSHEAFVDPAALTHSPSDEVLVNVVTEEPRRTMYGTELDSESRFGDFGSGSQFWGTD